MAHIIPFSPPPESDTPDTPALLERLRALRQQIEDLDRQEPEDMESEAYDLWGERHEALEDQVDELYELLEERGVTP